MYMDRTYVTQQRKVPIYDHGLAIFRDTIARHPAVKDRLRSLLLLAVAEERAGQLVSGIRARAKGQNRANRLGVIFVSPRARPDFNH
jgi:hypothetical protein